MVPRIVSSPLGPLALSASEGGLQEIRFLPNEQVNAPGKHEFQILLPGIGKVDDVLDETQRQLEAYFAGELEVFDLPLKPEGTPFQLRVWQALSEIVYGTTCSYLELAHILGDAKALRAVGRANGANPLPIVLPCHRVIGSDGSLTGYGGGLDRKRRLLELEGVLTQARLFDT